VETLVPLRSEEKLKTVISAAEKWDVSLTAGNRKI